MDVCLMCGHRGWEETLVYCRGCQVYAQHRYCLDRLPVFKTEDVTWFCVDCEPKAAKLSYVDKSNPLPLGISDSACLEKFDTVEGRLELKECLKRVKANKCWLSKKTKKHKKREDISGFLNKTKMPLFDGQSSLCDKTQCSENCEEDNSMKEDGLLQIDSTNSDESDSVQVSQVATSDDLNVTELDSYADAQPIADPIWRGSLCISHESFGTVTGLVAHVSSLACSKVQEEATLFPEVLHADLLQRSAVWPKGFKKSGPTDQSVALFFFPENERDEKFFDKLVDDIIRGDHAIRVVVENAELLIFASTMLPLQYWRFQAKYYLWGVFRGKQGLRQRIDVVSGEDKDVANRLTGYNRSELSASSNGGSLASSTQYSCASVC